MTFDECARRVRAFPGDHVAELALYDHCMRPRWRTFIGSAYPVLRRDVDDVLQDAFIAFHRLVSRRACANASALWMVMLRRMCAYYARAARYRREESVAPGALPDRLSPEPSPEAAMLDRERLEGLHAAIGKVARAQWRDVLLHLLDGELPRDARARLGLSVGGYAIAKYRARAAVARIVRDPLRSALRPARPPRPPRAPAAGRAK